MIVVTTPTGRIGSQLVRKLLEAGEAVRVIARDPERIPPEIRARVETVQGSSDNEGVLMGALDGAESLFLVVPPCFTGNDEREYYLQFTHPVCRAVRSRAVQRVVTVSGIGRRVPVKAGPVTASFAKDAALEETGVDFRALWCPGFMENMLRAIPSLRQHGVFSNSARADVKAPLVATRDIASSGARLLLDRSWSGQGGVAVLGPEDLSFDDMAAVMTDVLGRPIRFVSLSGEAYKAQLMQFGASEAMAQSLVEMHAAKDNGLDHAEPRTQENTTPTRFRQWCEEVLRPAFMQV